MVYVAVNAVPRTLFHEGFERGHADANVLAGAYGGQMAASDQLVHVLLSELEDLGDLWDREEPVRLGWRLRGRSRDQHHLQVGSQPRYASSAVGEHRHGKRVCERRVAFEVIESGRSGRVECTGRLHDARSKAKAVPLPRRDLSKSPKVSERLAIPSICRTSDIRRAERVPLQNTSGIAADSGDIGDASRLQDAHEALGRRRSSGWTASLRSLAAAFLP
jgi:hypothetical protein